MQSSKTAVCAAALAALVTLAACGGGDDPPAPAAPVPTPPAPTGSRSGVLSDSPVAGVAFTTSSGVSGTTDGQGRFTYNPGDTVTFRIGTLTLASGITPSPVVTPIDLAGGDTTRLTNLLVLLQSLDSDAGGDITIPASAATAVAGLDVGASTAAFAGALQSGINAAGIGRTVVPADVAAAHFVAEGMKLLADQIWVGRDGDGKPLFALQVTPDGNYQFGEVDAADEHGQTGVEAGTVAITGVDAGGYRYGAVTTVDTNGEWGLSHPQPTDRLRSVGDALVADSGDRIAKMDNVAGTIVGAWSTVNHPDIPAGKKAPLVLFFANGHVMFVDTIGEYGLEPGETSCSDGGVELGRYTYVATTGELVLTGNEVDTNECAGLWDAGEVRTTWKLTLGGDGHSLVAEGTDADGTFEYTLTRVSK